MQAGIYVVGYPSILQNLSTNADRLHHISCAQRLVLSYYTQHLQQPSLRSTSLVTPPPT